jgi:hypothetical protein
MTDTTLDWDTSPQPPNPTGINVFPDEPGPIELSSKDIPDHTLITSPILKLRYKNQKIIAIADWKKIVSCTADPITPFSHTASVTTGTSLTDSASVQFSVSMTASNDIGSISAGLSETFTRSITFSKSSTTSNTFSVTPKDGQVSVIWWQLVHSYILVGTEEIMFKNEVALSKEFKHTIENYADVFVSTSFPGNANNRLTTKGFENFL